MKAQTKNTILLTCLAVSAVAICPATASVLMLDFGPTTPTAGNLTNSPYHSANGSFTDGNWNTLGTADVASGLKFSDNTVATGVGVNIGTSTTTLINLGTQPTTTNALGSGTSGGVYAGNSVGTDAIFSGSGGSNLALGLQITGLSAGAYDIYVSARNTNTGSGQGAYTQAIFAGNSASTGNFDYSGYSSGTLNYAATSSNEFTTSWGAGENYIKLSVTLSASDVLNIAVDGNDRGFLNSVQIVSVPEPSAAILLSLGALGFAFRRSRKG